MIQTKQQLQRKLKHNCSNSYSTNIKSPNCIVTLATINNLLHPFHLTISCTKQEYKTIKNALCSPFTFTIIHARIEVIGVKSALWLFPIKKCIKYAHEWLFSTLQPFSVAFLLFLKHYRYYCNYFVVLILIFAWSREFSNKV